MGSLRISHSRKEILNVLKRIHQEEEEVFVWQNKEGKREIIYCQIEKIDPGVGNFSIRPMDLSQSLKLEKNLSLYIKGELESILFKQEVSFASGSIAILKIPTEIRVIEKRAVARTTFQFTDNKKIILAKYAPNSQRPRRFDLVTLDVSIKGISFFISPNQLLSFTAGDQVYVVELGGKKFSTPLTATVKYISRYSSSVDDIRGHRVGVQFWEPITQEILDLINKFGS